MASLFHNSNRHAVQYEATGSRRQQWWQWESFHWSIIYTVFITAEMLNFTRTRKNVGFYIPHNETVALINTIVETGQRFLATVVSTDKQRDRQIDRQTDTGRTDNKRCLQQQIKRLSNSSPQLRQQQQLEMKYVFSLLAMYSSNKHCPQVSDCIRNRDDKRSAPAKRIRATPVVCIWGQIKLTFSGLDFIAVCLSHLEKNY